MRSTSVPERKAALRAAAMGRLTACTPEELRRSDDALFVRFLTLPQTAQAEIILLYHGMGAEPDTGRLLEELRRRGKTVALPRCLPGGGMEAGMVTEDAILVRHPYGMLEPGEDCPAISRAQIDLILVPGLCFDRNGGRLGRGGGYYDRYLAESRGYTVALCRDVLLCDAVPREPHDRPVDAVVTESGVYFRQGLSPSPHAKRAPKGPCASRQEVK